MKKRRIISLILALLMMVLILPSSVFAEENDMVFKNLIEENDQRSFKEKDSEKIYYKNPNWNERDTKNEGIQKWPVSSGQRLTNVSIASEPLETNQLNYVGYHETTNGDLVLDLTFSWASRAVNIWDRVILFFSDDLSEKIDWEKSTYYYGLKGQYKNFAKVGASNQRTMTLDDMRQAAISGNTQYTPIRLVLPNTKRSDLDNMDTTIQTRVLNDNGRIYTKYLKKKRNSNLYLDGYNSYTSVTSVPKTTAPDFRSGLLPFLRTFKAVEQIPDIFSSQNTVSFYPENDQLYIASQFRKGSTGSSGKTDYYNNGDAMGYRLAFDKKLLDVLEEDENGNIGYIEPSTTSGKIAVNIMKNVTGFTRNQVNVKGDMAYVIYAPKAYDVTNGEKVIYTNGGTNGFINNQTSLITGNQYTLTRLNVSADKLKSLYPEVNGVKPNILPLDVYSAMILENTNSYDVVTLTTTGEVSISKGDNIELSFDKVASPNDKSFKAAIKIGNMPWIGDMGIYKSGSAGSLYSETGFKFDLSKKQYTSKSMEDIKIPAGTEIKIYANKDNLRNNPAKIVLNGKEVASYTSNDVKSSSEPRVLVGSEAYSSTLLERTQYMPGLLDTFDTDKNIEGYSYRHNQVVGIQYRGNDTNNRQLIEADTPNAATQNAKYLANIDGNIVEFPQGENGLYKFSKAINVGDFLLKDNPIVASAYNYNVSGEEEDKELKEGESAIRTAIGSDSIITKVLSTVTFDLNDGKMDNVKSFEGGSQHNGYIIERNDNTSPIKRIVPMNENFSTDEGYQPNGFIGDNILLKDNQGNDLKDNALELRKFVETDAEGKNTIKPEKAGSSFLGWTTLPITGTPGEVDTEFNKLKVATTAAETHDTFTNHIFTDASPVTKSMTVYAAYGTPKIRLHSNFDKDTATEGLQEYVDVQELPKEALDKLAAGTPANEVEAKLESVYDKDEFKREGYSLVGFSRNPDANVPDINKTVGKGDIVDYYLRDSEIFKLADQGRIDELGIDYNYTFDIDKGLDLYAVWKKDFTIKANKVWQKTNGENIAGKQEDIDKLKFALIGRPAVGTFGNEVLLEDATYYPIPGTVKDFNGGEVTWDGIKGYGRKGRRYSYLVVELATPQAEAAFNRGSTDWADYGIKITERDEAAGTYGHKDQLVEFANGNGVDAFTSATKRLHTTEQNPEGVNPHGQGEIPKVGYFDTTGYVFTVMNKELLVPSPVIKQDYEDDHKIIIEPPLEIMDKITITLPDGKTAVFVKNADGTGYEASNEGTTTLNLTVEDGKLVINYPDNESLNIDDVYTAVSEKEVAGKVQTSEKASMKVLKRPVSNKPENVKQEKLDGENIPISFTVPDPVTNKPTAGTEYTVVIVDKNGNETITDYKYIIPEEGSFGIPGSTQTILVPKDKLQDGDQVKIIAKEPDKKQIISDVISIDLEAPGVTAQGQDERWRRWADFKVTLDELPDGPIVVSYTKDGKEVKEEFGSKDVAEIEIKRLIFDIDAYNLKVTARDQFGNETQQDIEYEHIGKTSLIIKEPLAGKNFVWITPKEEGMTVTINVYAPGTDLDSYPRNKYFEFSDEYNKPQPVATRVIEFTDTNTKRTKVRMPDGFKFEEGQVVDIVGTTGTKRVDYKISNPYTHVVE